MAHGAVARIASISIASKAHPAPAPRRQRKPRCMTARHCTTRAGPLADSVDDPLPLDRHHWLVQPVLVSTAQVTATLSPTLSVAHIVDQRSQTRFRDLWVERR